MRAYHLRRWLYGRDPISQGPTGFESNYEGRIQAGALYSDNEGEVECLLLYSSLGGFMMPLRSSQAARRKTW